MTKFTEEQLFEICRLAHSAMFYLVEKSAMHVIAERARDRSLDAFFAQRDCLGNWYAEYAGHGRLRQAAGSIDGEQHTRRRFDEAVALRVAQIDGARAPDRDANLPS